MVLTLAGKVITRLCSTGGKVIKVITYMEMGDTFDSNDTLDANRGRWARGGYAAVAGGTDRKS